VLPDRLVRVAGTESMNATQNTTKLPVFKADFSAMSFPADYVGGAVRHQAERTPASLAVTQVLPRF
jgi:hypothetical protein